VQFPQPSHHSNPFPTKYSPQHPVLQHPKSMFLFELRYFNLWNLKLRRPSWYFVTSFTDRGPALIGCPRLLTQHYISGGRVLHSQSEDEWCLGDKQPHQHYP
jgi:hypothetical protein